MKNKTVGQGLAPAVKKTLSLLLSLIMLFSITAGIDLSAYAATAHTQQEAVNWANAQVGKSLDQDGVYGAQCVDLIRYYYIYLGVSPVSGNGCDYATNALPSGWSRIKYYSGFTPQPGDVAVWTYASSSHGHVAIVTSANSSSMNVVEQNGSTHVTRSHSYNYSYGTFWGVIRPGFTANNNYNTLPQGQWIWSNKKNVEVGEEVSFNFNAQYASWYVIGIWHNGNLTVVDNGTSDWYTTSFSEDGTYSVHAAIYNNMGHVDTEEIVITVNTPVNIGENFYAYIIKQDSWIHLENESGNVRLSSKLDIFEPKQIWHFIRQADNSYKIVNEYDGTCLDAHFAEIENGTNVGTYSDNGSKAQRWYICKNGTGYNIKASNCNKVLDVENNSNTGGANIQLYDSNNSAAQIFSIYNLTNDGRSYSKPNKPEKVTITGQNNAKKVTISWSESKVYSNYDNRKYNVNIYKNDGSLVYSNTGLTNRSVNITIPSYGTYKVSITAINTKYPNYNSVSESYLSFSEHKHTYNKNGTIIEAATCTSNGYKVYHCSGCNAMKTETIPATGHNYETTTDKATTKKNGNVVKKCLICEATTKTTIYYPKTVTLSTTSYTYNGKAKKPSVTVKDSKGKKIAASNYTVSYQSGRKNVGKYTVTIKFKGNYSGTVKKTFTIKPKATTLSSVTAGKKKFTAKWKKLTTQTTGYQIQYSTDKNFKKNNKTVTISKNKTTSKSVSKLKAKKKILCSHSYI